MSKPRRDAATRTIVASLQRAHDPIAREVAITGLVEDIASALARALGVPLLATLGDITHTRKTYQIRIHALQSSCKQ